MSDSPQFQRLTSLLKTVPEVPPEKREAINEVIRTADENFITPIDQIELNDAILIYRLVQLALKATPAEIAEIRSTLRVVEGP